jgi:hypothetical protein
MRVESESFKEKAFILEGEVARKIEEIDSMRGQQRSMQEKLDELNLYRGGEMGLKIEIE